jgi:hypothetical protein
VLNVVAGSCGKGSIKGGSSRKEGERDIEKYKEKKQMDGLSERFLFFLSISLFNKPKL